MADSPPGSGIPIIGPVLQDLAALFGATDQINALAAATERVETNVWSNAISLATFSYGLFGGIIGSLGDLIGAIGKALDNLIGTVIWGFIKRLFETIKNWILNLRNWIKLHVATLQQIQKNLDKARSQYFRKVIDIVQRIRKILVPFRLLHLGFAKKLDSYLVGLEGDIGAKWAKMIAHQNLVLGVLDTIIDPRNLLRPGSTLGSLGAMIAAVHGAIGAADMRTLFCMGPATVATPLVAPWATTRALTLGEIHSKSGTYAVYAAQRDQTLRQYAIDLGTTPLA
jgi:hypothetical protein